MTPEAQLSLHRERVRPEWIDYNGHVNVAYYTMISDHATDAFFEHIGIGQDYVARQNKSAFALDMRMIYLRELTEGTLVQIRTQLLALDSKRMQFVHHMDHAEEGWSAALSEWVAIHVDLKTRKSMPFQDFVVKKLGEIRAAHASLSRPPQLARRIGLSQDAA